MSLINDALKRASQTAKDRPAQAEVPAPMQPVPEPPPSKFNLLMAAGPVVVILVALAGWLLLQRFYLNHAPPASHPSVTPATAIQRPAVPPQGNPALPSKSAAPQTKPPTPVVVAKQVQPPPSIPSPGVTATVSPSGSATVKPASGASVPQNRTPIPPPVAPAIPIAAVQSPVVASQPAPAPVPVNPSYFTTPAPAAFPKLQVKGIFYNRSKPYALINGETLGEGEHIMGVTIKKILPNRVVVELNGQTKQLVFGE